jgi:hypothetical protein
MGPAAVVGGGHGSSGALSHHKQRPRRGDFPPCPKPETTPSRSVRCPRPPIRVKPGPTQGTAGVRRPPTSRRRRRTANTAAPRRRRSDGSGAREQAATRKGAVPAVPGRPLPRADPACGRSPADPAYRGIPALRRAPPHSTARRRTPGRRVDHDSPTRARRCGVQGAAAARTMPGGTRRYAAVRRGAPRCAALRWCPAGHRPSPGRARDICTGHR